MHDRIADGTGEGTTRDDDEWTAPGLRSADPAACTAVYDRYVGYVMTVLGRGFVYTAAGGAQRHLRIASAFDREELCQEAFAALFHQAQTGSFDVSRPIKPYLRRIAVNLALKRSGKGAREVLSAEPREGGTDGAPQEGSLERAECARLLEEFRGTLSDEERQVLAGYFEEKSGSQSKLGERLGLSRDQVYRTIVKIRESALHFFRGRGWLDGP